MAASVCTPASSSGGRSLSTSRYVSVWISLCARPATGGKSLPRANSSASVRRRVSAARRRLRASSAAAVLASSSATDGAMMG